MISHPSEYYENYTPGADTRSRARYDWLEPQEPAYFPKDPPRTA